jgi:hypothetical protein
VVGTLITSTRAAGVAVNGQYVYLATAYNSTGLKVVDASDKANPRLVASVLPSSGGSSIALKTSGATTLALVGGYFYGKGTGVQVIDVTNPLAPVALGFTSLASTPQAIVVADRYAYLACGSLGVQILDLGNPNGPALAGYFSGVGNASQLALVQTSAGNTLVVPTSAGLKLLNVSNPTSPSLISTALPTTSTYDAVALGAGVVAVAAGYPSNGLLMLDVSVPASPRLIGSLRTDGTGSRIGTGAGLALLSTVDNGAALNVVDARLPAQPSKLGAIQMISATAAVAVSGSSALVGTNTYNTSTASFSTQVWTNNQNPKRPLVTNWANKTGGISDLAFTESGKWALVGGNSGAELQVFEASTQTLLGRVALPFGAQVNAIKSRGNLVYIASGISGLIIIDLGLDGRAPGIIGSVDTTGMARGVEVVGNYAYVADDVKGLQVVDISNPGAPRLVGAAIPTPGAAQSVRAQGRYLFLAQATLGGTNGLLVFDLANPAAPAAAASLSVNGYARRLDVAGNLVYLASGTGGLVIVDASNPRLPVVARIFKTFGTCRDVKARGGLVYLADDYAVQAVVAISPTP